MLNPLAAEIAARTGKDPGEHYRALTAEFDTPYYTRIDAPATLEQKAKLEKLSPDAVAASTPRGGADHRQVDQGSREQRGDRGPQGRGRAGLVRGTAFGHGEHLQDLSRELQGLGSSGRDRE